MSRAGIKRLSINSLTPSSVDFLIVGVIIAKREHRTFFSKRDNSRRGVWGFTVRDSPVDYINVTAWGTPECVQSLHTSYRVGDVVDLINAKVSVRNPGEKEDFFQPLVTSCLELVYNEGISVMCLHDSEDCIDFVRLLHLPTKPPHNFLSLADIKANGRLLAGQYVNILAAVQKVSDVKEVQSKDGRQLHVVEIAIMDQTASGFAVQAWDLDTIQRAQCWQPRNTILFISDLKVEWDVFRRAMRGVVGARSIVTENPDTREAAAMAQFALSTPICSLRTIDNIANNMPHPDSIVNVISCHSVLVQAQSLATGGNAISNPEDLTGPSVVADGKFTGLVYATLHQLDIDGLQLPVTTKCSSCGQNIVGCLVCTSDQCSSNFLSMSSSSKIPETILSYDIRVTLLDHTGRLTNCRLMGDSAANLLGCTAEDFTRLNYDERTSLKWKFLLKKVAARLLVIPSSDSGPPLVLVVALQLVSLKDYSTRVPLF